MNETHNPELTANTKSLRKQITKEKRHLRYDFLKTLPITIHRKKVTGSYMVDFYCAAAKIAIEPHGSQHYEAQGQDADADRDKHLNDLRLTVLRYSNAGINHHFDGVCTDILQHISKASP